MSKSSSGKGPVPSRWLNCPRKATELIMKKFMAFKTPLSYHYDDQVPAANRFHPKMMFDICKSKKIKFGLWIDLTNTNRFYDKKEIEENDCRYLKLQCRGHGETPSLEMTTNFINIVHNFISQNPLDCIAVHCTHGFNRTGFLIVSYIVKETDCDLESALEMFTKVRPPGIYKSDYLAELYRRFNYDDDDVPPAPDRPDWCFDEQESNSAPMDMLMEEPETSDGMNGAGISNNRTKKKRNGRKAVFMEGVPGVYEFTDQARASHLKRKVQQMCGWKRSDFPGSQPVSMDVNNIRLLNEKPYRVSWKADGMRYMMLIDGENSVFFFDRDHNIFHVEGLRFPYRKNLHHHLKDTLLDGEMVIDKVGDENIPRYLAYDIIKFEGQDVGKMPFYPTRLQCIDLEIIKPRHTAMEAGIIKKATEPFSIRHKQFWDITQAASLLGEKFAATLSHEPDGLIFQPSKEHYKAGRCDDVLKWKPLDMNSVDFRLKIVKEEGVGIVSRKVGHLYVGQLDKPFATMKYTKTLKDLDGKIIECKIENSSWKFMRERTDKSYPNSYTTATAVCGSIRHPVTKEKLLDYIDKCRFEDESEMMPPPSKRMRR